MMIFKYLVNISRCKERVDLIKYGSKQPKYMGPIWGVQQNPCEPKWAVPSNMNMEHLASELQQISSFSNLPSCRIFFQDGLKCSPSSSGQTFPQPK